MFAKVKPYLITALVVVATLGALAMFAPEALKAKVRI